MKILFIMSGLTPYYNLVLTKLNQCENISIVFIASKGNSDLHKKEGVQLTKEDAGFTYYELEEKNRKLYFSFKGLWKIVKCEKPSIIVTLPQYAISLHINPLLAFFRICFPSKILLKTIPFRTPLFFEELKSIRKNNSYRQKVRCIILLLFNTILYKWLVYAHVCYIKEAYNIYESYGIKPSKIFITYNSPDSDTLFKVYDEIKMTPPKTPYNPYRLIHVGRLVEWKRVDLLINAVAMLIPSYSKCELLILGYGPKENELKILSKKLGLENAVQFIGGVYDLALLSKYFCASGIYVLAGMGGLSINDAMCFEKPIICSLCDGTEKALVRENYNGKYFNNSDGGDLIRAIRFFYENPAQIEIMGKRSRKIIQNEINIHTVLDGYIEAFRYCSKR